MLLVSLASVLSSRLPQRGAKEGLQRTLTIAKYPTDFYEAGG